MSHGSPTHRMNLHKCNAYINLAGLCRANIKYKKCLMSESCRKSIQMDLNHSNVLIDTLESNDFRIHLYEDYAKTICDKSMVKAGGKKPRLYSKVLLVLFVGHV